MTDRHTMAEHTIEIERVLDAPRELVWKMWTDPDEVARWWGPERFTTPREKIELDPHPGGVWRMTMVGPDGAEYPSDGRYLVVEPPERLSFGEESTDHPMIESSETTVDLIDLGDQRTRVLVTSRMVCSQELPDLANAGWNSQLDKLAALLAGHAGGRQA
jgi:uncharacterized protein YndB with AHSA1/START domain